ncbi:MAG TPA: hypothetical protein VM204_02835, partial [Gaiellaceae bacterium]|nr:hypothetical protein [Gaiellaceae bacterium]
MQRPHRRSRTLVATLVSLAVAGVVAVFTTIGVAAPAAIQYAPQNTAPPTISGEAREGATLTTSNGTWNSDSATTYTYRWQRCEPPATPTGCADIPGATSNTYVVQSADVGKRLRSVVTATNASGSAAAASAMTNV